MKNSFLAVLLIFFISAESSAQTAIVENFLTISDGAGGMQILSFGLDTAATDGIDIYLSEAPLPPLPPSGIFDARFNLPGGTESSLKDIREGNIPYTGESIHEFQYQVGSGTVIQIDWSLPADSSIKGRLQDVVLGTLIDVEMIGTGSYTVVNPGTFNKLKMTITYSDAVPVELTSFSASAEKDYVMLNWTTATETNNNGFEIQRASFSTTTAQQWEKIGFIKGNGNSLVPQSYSFTDSKLNGNKFQYRLKQIDFNGEYKYSNTIEIEISPKSFALYQNYPNPFNPNTTIKFVVEKQSHVTLKIYNILGNEIAELVNEIKPAGIYQVDFNTKTLSSGNYFYKLNAGSFTEVRKMTLLH